MNELPRNIKHLLTMNAADDFVAQRDQAMMMQRNNSMSSVASSPLSSLSPATGGGPSPKGSVQDSSTAHTHSNVASPMSSVSSPPISPPTQSSAPSPNTPLSSSMQVGYSAVDGNDTSHTRWASSRAQGQLQRERPTLNQGQVPVRGVMSYNPMLIAPNLTDQNGVQSPPSVGSNGISSPDNSSVMLTAWQDFSAGQLQSHTLSPVGSGESFSGTPSPYSSAVGTVPSPPNPFSPEMGPMLHTTVSTDSIPSVTSVPFQNSPESSSFIPEAPPNDFNSQIPTDFNFSTNTSHHLNNLQSSKFVSGFDGSMQGAQQFDSSNPLVNSSDSVLQQLLGEMVALNDDSNLSSVASVPNGTTMTTMDSNLPHSHPNTNFMPNSSAPAPIQGNSFAMSYDVALTQLNVAKGSTVSHLLSDSQTNTGSSNSNPEVQDILQQFM